MKKKELDYGVIDNFLPQEKFQIIQSAVMDEKPETAIGWVYTPAVAHENEVENYKYFYLIYNVYYHTILSSFYEKLIPVLNELYFKSLIRIKCNLYPNSEKIHEHKEHVDTDYPHKAAIFSINTCNGYTKLEDGTKIDSVANRMLLFDASKPHCSTTTSDTTARFNINFNYF